MPQIARIGVATFNQGEELMNPVVYWVIGYLGVGLIYWLLMVFAIKYRSIIPQEWQQAVRCRLAEGGGSSFNALSPEGFLALVLMWWAVGYPNWGTMMAGALFLRAGQCMSRQFAYWRMLPEERQVVRLERLKKSEEENLEGLKRHECYSSTKRLQLNRRKFAAIDRANQLKLDIQNIQAQKHSLSDELMIVADHSTFESEQVKMAETSVSTKHSSKSVT